MQLLGSFLNWDFSFYNYPYSMESIISPLCNKRGLSDLDFRSASCALWRGVADEDSWRLRGWHRPQIWHQHNVMGLNMDSNGEDYLKMIWCGMSKFMSYKYFGSTFTYEASWRSFHLLLFMETQTSVDISLILPTVRSISVYGLPSFFPYLDQRGVRAIQ